MPEKGIRKMRKKKKKDKDRTASSVITCVECCQ